MRKALVAGLVAAVLMSLFAVTANASASSQARLDSLAPEVATILATLPEGGTTTVIVTLRDRADLTTAPGATRGGRLRAVIQTLRARTDASQAGVRALLRIRKAQGKVTVWRPFWVLNAISVTATADVIRELAAFPGVESVTSDAVPIVPTAAVPEPNLSAVAAPALWGNGAAGQGVVVATLDSGVDISHPDLAGRWRGGSNSWFDPYGQHPGSPVDLSGHGTGTMGVIVGGDAGGTSIGMAPGASWIAARIFNDQGSATATAIHAAFQWILDPDGDPNTDDAPNVVNSSWSYGYGGTCNLAFQPDVQALRAAGILPVFAAGNFGPYGSTSVSPANYPESLAVGAVNNADQIYFGGSRGPSACGQASTPYPELVAPGVGIRTAGRFGTYQVLSGTSLAAPHVAGALALLLSANPNLTASAQESALLQGAHDLGVAGFDNVFGLGRLDVLAAYGGVSTPDFGLAAAPSSATVSAGGSTNYAITVSALNGFTGDVAMSVTGLPAGASASFSPATVTGGTGASQLTITTPTVITAGSYPLTINGSFGSSNHTIGVSLVVTPSPDFGLAAAPSSATVSAGGSTNYAITVSALNGFTGDVALAVTGLPAGASASFSPATVNGGTGASQLTITTPTVITAGSYPLTINGSFGSSNHTIGVSLVVTPSPDFGLAAAPSSATVSAGGSTNYAITVSALNGFTGDVAMSVTGLPAGASASFSPATVNGGAGASQLTITTPAGIAAGSYPLTISGSSALATHASPVTLVVSATTPDFTLAATPGAISVKRNGQGTVTVAVASVAGFSNAVTLSVSGLRTWVTASFSKNPVAPGGQSTLTLKAGRFASTGTFTLTIKGTAGGKTHTQTVSVTVT